MSTQAPRSPLASNHAASWEGFIGQEDAVLRLKTAARSARMRGEPMEHTLIVSGTPGLGKTTLAMLAGAEMGGQVRVVSGRITSGEARLLLAEMDDGDVIVWDEFHQAVEGGKAATEWLLHYLPNGVIVGPRGPEAQPKVTIIGATTDTGKLPETLLDCFAMVNLVSYDAEQGTLIALEVCHRIFPHAMDIITVDNARAISEGASRNPRVMGAIAKTIRDIWTTTEAANYLGATKGYDIDQALAWQGLTLDGLTLIARRYLMSMISDFHGEPAGQKAIADCLQEPGGLGYTERILMTKGFIAKTSKGRLLTQLGIRRARALLKGEA